MAFSFSEFLQRRGGGNEIDPREVDLTFDELARLGQISNVTPTKTGYSAEAIAEAQALGEELPSAADLNLVLEQNKQLKSAGGRGYVGDMRSLGGGTTPFQELTQQIADSRPAPAWGGGYGSPAGYAHGGGEGGRSASGPNEGTLGQDFSSMFDDKMDLLGPFRGIGSSALQGGIASAQLGFGPAAGIGYGLKSALLSPVTALNMLDVYGGQARRDAAMDDAVGTLGLDRADLQGVSDYGTGLSSQQLSPRELDALEAMDAYLDTPTRLSMQLGYGFTDAMGITDPNQRGINQGTMEQAYDDARSFADTRDLQDAAMADMLGASFEDVGMSYADPEVTQSFEDMSTVAALQDERAALQEQQAIEAAAAKQAADMSAASTVGFDQGIKSNRGRTHGGAVSIGLTSAEKARAHRSITKEMEDNLGWAGAMRHAELEALKDKYGVEALQEAAQAAAEGGGGGLSDAAMGGLAGYGEARDMDAATALGTAMGLGGLGLGDYGGYGIGGDGSSGGGMGGDGRGQGGSRGGGRSDDGGGYR